MYYLSKYNSPLGEILLCADDNALLGLWFYAQKHFGGFLNKVNDDDKIFLDTSIIKETKAWLDVYFSGKNPSGAPPVSFIGTDFQKSVWEVLCTVSYSKVITYGEIAQIIAKKRGVKKISARATGVAIGHNPISIIVPCHRVIGKNGSLTGYAAGIERKIRLLELEGVKINLK